MRTTCYCEERTPDLLETGVICKKCRSKFHASCLDPSHGKITQLFGDVFYTFICKDCNYDKEYWSREILSWINMLNLILYNFHKENPGKTSFSLKNEIHPRILSLHAELMGNKPLLGSWKTTVASILSSHSQVFTNFDGDKNNWALSNPEKEPVLTKRKTPSQIAAKKKQEKTAVESVVPFSGQIASREACLNISDKKRLKASFPEPEPNNTIIKLKKTETKSAVRRLLSPETELEMLQKLNENLSIVKNNTNLFRLRRKLVLRQEKRSKSLRIFNFDSWVARYLRSTSFCQEMTVPEHDNGRIHPLERPPNCIPFDRSFLRKLNGDPARNLDYRISQYSGILLPHIAYQDKLLAKIPKKLKILTEIKKRNAKNNADEEICLDYCYFRREDLNQVNTLLTSFFWPGIDVSEGLDAPEFSLVVKYKLLIIGVGIMSPSGYISYLFVHPDWEGAGIASKLLYLLISSKNGLFRDITLHVAANNNNACILYQKFGFKAEQFIVNFYDKYVDENDRNALKNALFLRLRLPQ